MAAVAASDGDFGQTLGIVALVVVLAMAWPDGVRQPVDRSLT
jgi:hypothetical protein